MSNRNWGRGSALLLALAAFACGKPEQRVVDQYFNAINAQDNQTLSSFSTVQFDKKAQHWRITAVSETTTVPAPLPDLAKTAKEIEGKIADNKKAASAYVLEHPNDVDQVRELSRKNAKIPARLKDVAEQWDKFNETDRDLKKSLAEAKDAVDKERREVVLSVRDLPDLETLPGEMSTKTVDLEITVDGQPHAYTMGLKKYDLQTPADQGRVVSRWIVYRLDPK
jgi:hypothetical protein